jgi:hypothetical protein
VTIPSDARAGTGPVALRVLSGAPDEPIKETRVSQAYRVTERADADVERAVKMEAAWRGEPHFVEFIWRCSAAARVGHGRAAPIRHGFPALLFRAERRQRIDVGRATRWEIRPYQCYSGQRG